MKVAPILIAAKRLLMLVTAGFCLSSFAQTEADIMRWVELNKPRMEAGELAPLTFYKELHRRVAEIPTAAYRYKAENLRMLGKRIDLFEDVAAGKITMEKANRVVIEEQAAAENQEVDREAARIQAIRAQDEARTRQFEREQAQAAQQQTYEEQQRRARYLAELERQRTQNNENTRMQLEQIQRNQPITCNTNRYGNSSQTTCR